MLIIEIFNEAEIVNFTPKTNSPSTAPEKTGEIIHVHSEPPRVLIKAHRGWRVAQLDGKILQGVMSLPQAEQMALFHSHATDTPTMVFIHHERTGGVQKWLRKTVKNRPSEWTLGTWECDHG